MAVTDQNGVDVLKVVDYWIKRVEDVVNNAEGSVAGFLSRFLAGTTDEQRQMQKQVKDMKAILLDGRSTERGFQKSWAQRGREIVNSGRKTLQPVLDAWVAEGNAAVKNLASFSDDAENLTIGRIVLDTSSATALETAEKAEQATKAIAQGVADVADAAKTGVTSTFKALPILVGVAVIAGLFFFSKKIPSLG